jgi:tRNA threonylcarbamoyladenosine biosynthesis protein TsaB
MAEVERLLLVTNTQLNSVTHLAVSIGPGSFTGLRIGLSAAKGLCLACNKPLVAVPTLAALAARLPAAGLPVCATLDARKGELYAAVYATDTCWPKLLMAPQAITAAALLAELGQQRVFLAGPGVPAYPELQAGAGGHHAIAPPDFWRLEAAAVGHLALAGLDCGALAALSGQALEALEPAYLRTPDLGRPHGARPR